MIRTMNIKNKTYVINSLTVNDGRSSLGGQEGSGNGADKSYDGPTIDVGHNSWLGGGLANGQVGC